MGLFSLARSSRFARKPMLLATSLLSVINKLIPKDSKKVLFYESHDGPPSDNSEAMCHWMIASGLAGCYSITYCANSLGLLVGYPIKLVGRVGGVISYLRSKYVFYSFGGMRIKPSDGQVVVNLWHGAPLKSIGKLTSDEAYLNEDLDDFTYILSPSRLFSHVFASAFGCSESKVIEAGYPRCDYLKCKRRSLSEFGMPSNEQGLKRILWMPTFRKSSDGRFSQDYHSSSTGLPLLETHEDLEMANDVLKSMKCILVVKTHHDAVVIPQQELSNIIFCDNDTISASGHRLYEFVAQFDALLTDYSSISFDYLLLDRPIAFTIDDIDEYKKKRGFSVRDPLSLMPGDHIKTLVELYSFFESVATGIDSHADERHELAASFAGTLDGYNSARLAKLLGMATVDYGK